MSSLAGTIRIEDRVRPCVIGKHKALFHRWADKLENLLLNGKMDLYMKHIPVK